MPMSAAASLRTPPARSSAWRIVSRSTHSRLRRSSSDGSPFVRAGPTAIERSAAVMTGPPDSTTARSTVFSSSRTLPGQSYWRNSSRAESSIPVMFRPVRCACLRTKCAANVHEQARLGYRFRDRRAIDFHERHVALPAAIVNRPSDEFLSGAGLARHEHRGLRVSDSVDPIDDRAHRRTAADDAVVVELLVALAAEVPAFRTQALVVERAPHRREQLVDFERLAQI